MLARKGGVYLGQNRFVIKSNVFEPTNELFWELSEVVGIANVAHMTQAFHQL